MQEIISRRMSDRVLLCMWRLSIKILSKKSSWRAVVVKYIILSRQIRPVGSYRIGEVITGNKILRKSRYPRVSLWHLFHFSSFARRPSGEFYIHPRVYLRYSALRVKPEQHSFHWIIIQKHTFLFDLSFEKNNFYTVIIFSSVILFLYMCF